MRNYYKKNFKEYINKTINCDIENIYSFFLKHIKESDKTLLDIGFGSSRDSIYFSKRFDVTSIDPINKFVRHAKKMGLKNVYKMKVENIKYDSAFDLIWANASLLHVKEESLNDVFKKISKALKINGTMYCSFKYGDFVGIRDNRYYIDLTEKSVLKYLEHTNLKIKEFLITEDSLNRTSTKWLNLILVKE